MYCIIEGINLTFKRQISVKIVTSVLHLNLNSVENRYRTTGVQGRSTTQDAGAISNGSGNGTNPIMEHKLAAWEIGKQ